jgi:quinol-cytochrome oxidoreductase complex cytochrome b subunit
MNPFEIVAEKLINLGFYDFLFPFIITSAIFYGLFKKTKILGDSVVINGVLALSIAFLIFGFPKLVGVALATPFSRFFVQATIWVLIIGIGVLIAGFFYPDLTAFLSKAIERRTILFAMIVLGVAFFITSGLLGVFIGGWSPGEGEGDGGVSTDIIIIGVAVIIFIVLIFIASGIAGAK